MNLAHEILRMARCIQADDHRMMEDRIKAILEDQIVDLVEKFDVEVNFAWGYFGKHYRETMESPEEFPEFETRNEKATIKNHIQRIDTGDIKDDVVEELLKVSDMLTTSPEELVESADFRRILDHAIHAGDWTVEDVEVKLPGGNTTETTLDLKVTLQGEEVVVEATVDLSDILEKVNDNADDWYPPEETDDEPDEPDYEPDYDPV